MNVQHEKSQYVAEFIGTFFLVFFGCGSMILSEVVPGYNGSLIPLVWGGAVSIMIYAVGHISGAHFNPVVTVSFWITKRFPSKRLFGYLLAQVLGALSASAIHFFIWNSGHKYGMTISTVTPEIAFLIEFILSFSLMFVIMSVSTDSRAIGELAGIAIGTTVALCAFVGGPLTNASMNPARSIAPAIFNGDFSNLWIYLLAPLCGAAIGAIIYERIRCSKDGDDNTHGCC